MGDSVVSNHWFYRISRRLPGSTVCFDGLFRLLFLTCREPI